MKIKMYVFSLLYLIISCTFTMGVVTLAVYIFAKIYLFFTGVPFYFDLPKLIKSLKAMLSAGAVCGLGCWCISLWNSRR